jgi:hypothetical protein
MIKKKLIGALTLSLLLMSCGDKPSRVIKLEKSIDILIVLKERLSTECDNGIEISCTQMTALVDTIDLSIVKGVPIHEEAHDIYSRWVDSHNASRKK